MIEPFSADDVLGTLARHLTEHLEPCALYAILDATGRGVLLQCSDCDDETIIHLAVRSHQ